ncbi:hypothetical protein LJB95_00060 [Paludibacteraceae bacterium OttesenSCG-928-F17]|nr:hypothetical protein [Paludibacteraceae bacterium OttesenSCG-928-F17]
MALFTFSSCSLVIGSLLGLKNPVVETKETINSYISESGCDMTNNFVLRYTDPDSTTVINNILKSLGSDFLLFDSSGVRYCYNQAEKCAGVRLENALMNIESNFEPCVEDSLHYDNILLNLEPLTSNDRLSSNSEYQMIYY